MTEKRFHLKCEKCGVVQHIYKRVRRCHQIHYVGLGKRAEYCWGHMIPVPRRVRRTPQLDEQIDKAETKLAEAITRVKKAMALVDRWQRRIQRLQRKRAKVAVEPGDYNVLRVIDLKGGE